MTPNPCFDFSPLQLFRITRDRRCQKLLWILGFSATFNHLSGPHRKQVYFSGFKMKDFDLFCVFQVSLLLNFIVRVFASFSSQVFLPSFRNMASLDSQGEIVPVELPNPA